MKVLLGLAAGYLLGARTAGPELDDVVRSLRALRDSDEFQDLLVSVRNHAGHTLRELAAAIERTAATVDPEAGGTTIGADRVAGVRDLAGRR